MDSKSFGENFVWGVASAAAQVEGSIDAEGKGPSIWDTFVKKKNKIKKGQDHFQACDFYYRYREDIQLMRRLNIRHFRFSIAWSRILPEGGSEINEAGVQFYNELIDYCLEQGVTPWVTLYHWDLPQSIEDRGGWTSRGILTDFEQYVIVCAEKFGDRVKHWMVLNEPVVFTGAGYFLGIHAPGRYGLSSFLAAVHHSTLAMGVGGRILRHRIPDAKIGTTFSCSPVEPKSNRPSDLRAAQRVDAILNRLFIEPILGMGYPTDTIKALKRIERYVLPEDKSLMPFKFDFIGIQNYTREVVARSFFMPYLNAKLVPPAKRGISETTAMGWEVYPEAIYTMIRQFAAYENCPPIYITENGAAFPDTFEDGEVHDEKRRSYIEKNLEQILRARKEGISVEGYFVWTFTDNFEWAEGYDPRFGIVYVDFKTQGRYVKDSGKWYSEFIR